MLKIKSFVTIFTSLIVIIFVSVNNLTNCELTKSHHPQFIQTTLRSLGDVNNEGDLRPTIGPFGAIDQVTSDVTTTNLLITTDQYPDPRATERTILLPSITSPELDYYPQITGWCPDCCDEDEIFVKSEQKCLKKSFIADECTSSEQCIVPQSTCLRNMCVCIDYYVDFSRTKCTPIHNTAIEIYKITMIFASSCLALILLIFLACILRKSYCPADSSHQGTNRSTINDLFTIYPGTSGSPSELFSSLTPAEKPPSYNETMRMINQEIGTPPPAYHNIFYTETSSSATLAQSTSSISHQNSNIFNSNEPPPSSSQPSQSTNCNNGLAPATSSTQLKTTINAQNHNLYSSSSFNQSAIPSAPLIAVFNQGRVNSAFDCDS